MRSCLYEGVVGHRRFRPVKHAFRYSLFMLWLDLDEADDLARRGLFALGHPWSSAAFLPSDHLPGPRRLGLRPDQEPARDIPSNSSPEMLDPAAGSGQSPNPQTAAELAQAVRKLVAENTGLTLTGPVRLLTQLRYFGYYFSPLNVYYCYQADESLACVVAEVNNIPWRERHWYFLWSGNEQARPGVHQHPKAFHVSPFMPMEQQYRWRLFPPGERLLVHLANLDAAGETQPIFSSTLALQRAPLTRGALAGAMLRHGWMSAKVVAAIYYEAFCLWLKNCPSFAHPATLPQPRSQQT